MLSKAFTDRNQMLTLYVPKHHYRSFRGACSSRQTSMSSVLNTAIIDFLTKASADARLLDDANEPVAFFQQ